MVRRASFHIHSQVIAGGSAAFRDPNKIQRQKGCRPAGCPRSVLEEQMHKEGNREEGQTDQIRAAEFCVRNIPQTPLCERP